MSDYYAAPLIPKAFIWRRAHSLTGLWFALFLIEHLFVNSQAALLIGDDGNGFVKAVNAIRSLPYLPVIEITLLAVPFFIHAIWGIKYIFTSQSNSFQTDGSLPSLPQYPINRAYTWQRITSWILLIGILAHVIHMRFIEYPTSMQMGTQHYYMVSLNQDDGLYTLSKRLGFDLFDQMQVKSLVNPEIPKVQNNTPESLIQAQTYKEQMDWNRTLQDFNLKSHQMVAVAHNFGVAELLMVRDTFKNPIMILLYTGLVLAACFHGFNGLWTFMIRWGVTLTHRSQQIMRKICVFLMVLITFLGLAAIWGTYWINLMS